MRVLFDQNVPRDLARHLKHHTVVRTAEIGWEELRNGDLLKQAEAKHFDVLVTADSNLKYQQNLTDRKISVVALSTNNWPTMEPHVAKVVTAVDQASEGRYEAVRCGVFLARKFRRNLRLQLMYS